tara:strand:+ start:201 stop:584 length:384 start_codon:yes stop_codon:yes gene_type:complete
MAVPLMRSYTTPGLALNVFGLATDDITQLTITQMNRSNIILDSVSNPQPTGGEIYQDRVLINGLESGVTFFSNASDPASAGRVVPGPVPIEVGGAAGGKQVAFNCGQTTIGAGAAGYSFLVKYANLF